MVLEEDRQGLLVGMNTSGINSQLLSFGKLFLHNEIDRIANNHVEGEKVMAG